MSAAAARTAASVRFCALLCASLALARGQAGSTPTYDVVVYGATSAGVIAAVQAGDMGKTVALIEPSHHIGGMTSGGLGFTDIGEPTVIGGLAQQFYQSVYHFYEGSQRRAMQTGAATNPVAVMQWQFEPHVAENILLAMLSDANVKIMLGQALHRHGGVAMTDRQITALTLESGQTVRGRVFIDATYEGDLMASAGVPYRIGREAIDEYDEPLNGVFPDESLTGQVDPFVLPGVPSSGLLPGVENVAVGAAGTGDQRVQQFNLRVCMTADPGNQSPLVRPADYNPANYELLIRFLANNPAFTLMNDVCKFEPLPNGKFDVNANNSFSTDMSGPDSSAWADWSYAERGASYQRFLSYTQGLFYFLATDPRVPAAVQSQALVLRPAADEFADNGNWPSEVYVREARRMVGAYVMTEHEAEGAVVVPDPVAYASYGMDAHKVTIYADAAGLLHTEGYYFGAVTPYPVSYRALTPAASACGNLLVPVCLSATHVAFDSIRIEPTFMMLGQAAGTAAALAIDEGKDVQAVDYSELASRLRSDGQVLQWSGAAPAAAPAMPPLARSR